MGDGVWQGGVNTSPLCILNGKIIWQPFGRSCGPSDGEYYCSGIIYVSVRWRLNWIRVMR